MALLVKSKEHFIHVLARLQANQEGVMFWNASREFRIMLRYCDPESFDIAIVCDPSSKRDELLTGILSMECSGFMDEDDFCYVLENYPYEEEHTATSTSATSTKSMRKLNEVYTWRLCACAGYFVKSLAHEECLYCTLSSEECSDDTATTTTRTDCPVCLRTSAMAAMSKQSECCGQYIHALCLKQWLARNPTCPLCRQPACKSIV